MKNIFKYLGLSVLLAGVMFACSPEKIQHPSEAGVPNATDIEPVITVDQTINQVTFSLPKGTQGYVPVWLFQDKKGEWTQYCAQNDYVRVFATAGDYAVRMQLMNSNGISPDYVQKTFHLDNTLFDFSKYDTMLTGGEAKEWRIDNSAPGHLGCGPSGTNGLEWWSAVPDDKKDWGVYDNRMTFTLEGNVYDFVPGEHGTIYVNKDITQEPYGSYNTNDGNDYCYPVDSQTSTWKWEVEGEDLFLVLPENTYWPYYAFPAFISNPRLKVESITPKEANLVIDDGANIAWHFIITSGAAEVKFNGFNYEHEANVWRPVDADDAHTYHQFYAPGWSEVEKPAITCENGTYSFNLPQATTDQWQCQFFIIPNDAIALEAAKSYDFSCIVTPSQDLNNVTFKLVDVADDNNYLFVETRNLTAYDENVFYMSNLPGVDAASVKMVFDFGGNPDNTDIAISRITLKDHAIDDGTVLPEIPDGPAPEEYAYDHEANIWKPADAAHTYSFYYAPGWSQIENPEVVNEGNEYVIALPQATFEAWQSQFFIIPDSPIALEAAKSYDFSVVMMSTTDVNQATVKYTDTASDGNFLFDKKVSLKAFEECIIDISDAKLNEGNDAEASKIVFDFGGNPADTEITIRRIVLKDHSVDDGTHK